MIRLLLALLATGLPILMALTTLAWPANRFLVFVSQPTPAGTPWSTLGVVADGVTDNTAALNALPTNTTIIGDCPAGSSIRINSPWIWQSNLTIYQQRNCPIISYVLGIGSYAIIQSNESAPITNVFYDGMQIGKAAVPAPLTGERILEAWIDHFTLTHFTIGPSGGFAFIRGSDQEFAYGTMTAYIPLNAGAPGIRHIGNIPKVPTSPGRPANVWAHNNYMVTGDATYQSCQPLATSLWINVSSDDILYENSTGYSNGGLILIGEGGQTAAFSNWTCSNIVYRNLGSTAVSNVGIHIGSSAAPNAVSNVSISNVSFDGAGSVNINPVIWFDSAATGGTISNVTLDTVSVINAYERSLGLNGNGYSNITFKNGVLGSPRTHGLANVYFANVTQATLQNSSIGALAGDAITVGAFGKVSAPANNVSILNNTIFNVSQQRAGVDLVSADHAIVTGNTLSSNATATRAIGIQLSAAGKDGGPGTTNATVSGNNVSAVVSSLNQRVVCAPGQGNTVTGNTGVSDCPP